MFADVKNKEELLEFLINTLFDCCMEYIDILDFAEEFKEYMPIDDVNWAIEEFKFKVNWVVDGVLEYRELKENISCGNY